ncbi:MAG: hypothetical protein MZV64_23450 [Ignavibacteriales bacterium]|nr:hypothetical protein [Ignavibacteriales bacterium]
MPPTARSVPRSGCSSTAAWMCPDCLRRCASTGNRLRQRACSSARSCGLGSSDSPMGPSPRPCGPWQVSQFVLKIFAPSADASALRGLVLPAYSAGTDSQCSDLLRRTVDTSASTSGEEQSPQYNKNEKGLFMG